MADLPVFGSLSPEQYAQDAREMAAARHLDMVVPIGGRKSSYRPDPMANFQMDEKYKSWPLSENVEDHRDQPMGLLAGLFHQLKMAGPSLDELKTMIEHPMTPYRQLFQPEFMSDGEAPHNQMQIDAGANVPFGSLAPLKYEVGP